MTGLFFLATIVGSAIGALLTFFALTVDSAPQQAALAGIALCLAVIPYVLYRVFYSNTMEDKVDDILRALAGGDIRTTTHVKCPDCRSFVQKDAKTCPHCHTALTPQ